MCEREIRDLPENERLAALAAVADALDDADLSDDTIFRVDLDPITLAQTIRAKVPATIHRAALSAPATELFGLVLDQTCYYLAHLVRELPEFQARAAVETLSRLTGIAGQLGEVLERLPVTTLDAAGDDNQDDRFLNQYAKLVSTLYDRLDILGITTNHYEPSVTLSVAYLSLTAAANADEKPRRGQSLLEPGRFGTHDLPKPVVRVEDALGHKQRVLIEGDAGAGKSTLLQWLAITSVRQRFAGRLADWNGLVPFLIRLRDFADLRLPDGDGILLHANAPQWGIVPEGWVHRMAAAGRALFLVDGVDELPDHDRSKVRTWLQSIGVRYPECRIVVTSRPSDSTERWLTRNRFHRVTLQPMTPEDVRVFVDRWHSALLDASAGESVVLPCQREDVPKHQRTLHAHLAARPHLRSLARNPLLCAMICALNLDRGANLPRDRMTLYEAALDMLLERRDVEKHVWAASEFQLSAVQKRALLRALAWWLNENRRAEMSQEEAIYQLQLKIGSMPGVTETPREVLTYLLERSGLLRQPVLGRIDFVHRTFQEFLAAKEVVERDSIDMLVNNAHSDLWRETVLMACAHATTPQRDRLLTGIINRAYDNYRLPEINQRRQLMLLAAACMEIAVEVSADVIRRVEVCLHELLPPVSSDEVNTLATLGSALLRTLPEDLRDMEPQGAMLTVRAVALSNEEWALDVLAKYAQDPRWEVQDELMTCARYFDLGVYVSRVLADAPFFGHELEITDAAWLPHLNRLWQVRSVHVKIYPDQLESLAVLAEIPHLHRLLVSVSGDCDVAPLSRHLDLNYLNLTCEGAFSSLSVLSDFVQLQELALTPGLPVDDLGFLGPLRKLRRLKVSSIAAEADLAILETSRSLQSLEIRDCRAHIDVEVLATLPHLNRLDVRGCAEQLDLSPLAGRGIRLLLEREQVVTGLDELGENSEIQLF